MTNGKPRIRLLAMRYDRGVKIEDPRQYGWHYHLRLPFKYFIGPEFPSLDLFGILATSNICDCYAMMICADIEIGGLMEIGDRTQIWSEELKDFDPVII